MNKDLLRKYFEDQCTEDELNLIAAWLEESAGNSDGKSTLYEIWSGLPDKPELKGVDFDQILNRIHHHINLAQTKKALNIANNNLSRFKKRENFLKVITRVAAILLIPVISYSLIVSIKYQSVKQQYIPVNQAYNEVFSSVDAITKVTLPDGSNVWLNHSSSLRYPATFQGQSRTVELKGEGYFEVTHNKKLPFIVKTGEIEVEAVGTTFNILSYPDEEKIETSLINGIVNIDKSSSDNKLERLLAMKPSQLAIYQKSNNEISIRTIPDDRYFSWKDGKLIFNKEPMGEVVKKLRRWFNIEIQIKDPRLLDLTFTGTFVNENLTQVMELLAMVSPINYSISDRKEITDGTFSRRTVVLTYRRK